MRKYLLYIIIVYVLLSKACLIPYVKHNYNSLTYYSINAAMPKYQV